MVKCIYLTLITSILLFPLSEAPAQTRTWHDTGGCGGHKLGECWPLPGQVNACGQPATSCCIPTNAHLPPSPCANTQLRKKKLIPVDPENRFGNATIHRKLQYVTHDSPHFDPGALSIDKKRKIKRGLKPIDLNERIQ
jgi:hypothetical protein